MRAVAPLLRQCSRVLELGCGQGDDAAYLVMFGHDVISCDFVDAVVAANGERFRNTKGVAFRVMRTDTPFPDIDCAFDVVYAHLALHYFQDDVTGKIFGEIRRVLAPGGLLAFACKSNRDPLYGQGTMIEPDMYELRGHVRHFFSDAYARRLLAPAFDIEHLEIRSAEPDCGTSSLVEVIARAR